MNDIITKELLKKIIDLLQKQNIKRPYYIILPDNILKLDDNGEWEIVTDE